MIDEELKKIINELESILKKDSRFITNGDDKYHDQIKKIYKDSKYGRKPIDVTNLVNLNNMVDIGDVAYLNHINRMLIVANRTLDALINN